MHLSVLSVVFLVAVVVLFLVIRASLWFALRLYLATFAPNRVARLIPGFIAATDASWRTPGSDEPLEQAAHRLAKWTFERLIKPSIPGAVEEFNKLRRGSQAEPAPDVVRVVELMSERCSQEVPLSPGLAHQITYSDPIHGTIEFEPKFRWLLTHPVVQRLNEVRQLPFAFPKYPAATHTRFSHSLGVAHLARTIVQRVMERGVVYTASGAKEIELDQGSKTRLADLATVCGLVHDLGHGPLGHTLDRFFQTRIFEGDGASDADKELLPRVLKRVAEPIGAIDGLTADEVAQVLAGEDLEGWSLFVSQLLNSKLDVDRIDYLQRDAHFTGQLEGLLNIEALISSVRPFENSDGVFLTFDRSYLGDVEQFVYARDAMYLRCYEHRVKVVSEALSSRAVDALFKLVPGLKDHLDAFAMLTDAQLIEVVNQLKDDEEGGPKDLFRRVLRCEALEFSEVAAVPFADTYVEGWLKGLLGDVNFPSEALLEKIAQTERKIAKAAGVSRSQVVLVLPDPKAAEERSTILDILILCEKDLGYDAVPLLTEKEDTSVSDVLQRLKFVSKDFVDEVVSRESGDPATKLAEISEAAATGLSLIGIIRRARFKLRLFLHNSRLEESRAAVVAAFRALGVKAAGSG